MPVYADVLCAGAQLLPISNRSFFYQENEVLDSLYNGSSNQNGFGNNDGRFWAAFTSASQRFAPSMFQKQTQVFNTTKTSLGKCAREKNFAGLFFLSDFAMRVRSLIKSKPCFSNNMKIYLVKRGAFLPRNGPLTPLPGRGPFW